MKIKNISLHQFRSFTDLELKLHPELTVIVGNNGSGKTSILDGISLFFGSILRRLPNVQGINSSIEDIRIVEGDKKAYGLLCTVKADISREINSKKTKAFEGIEPTLNWSTTRFRDQSNSTKFKFFLEYNKKIVGAKQAFDFADKLVEAETTDQYYEMPILVYYGTDRAIFNTPLRRRNFKNQFARFDSLAGALNPTSNFKRVFEWFHAKENEEAREQKKQKSFEYEDQELRYVREAISAFFPEFGDPRTEIRPLRFVVDIKKGKRLITLNLNQLSDGYRTSLALVADLASRMVEANPPDKVDFNPLHSEAIVMIDEVDLHLHPSLQQQIIPRLKAVFPKTQFILTTHSPQVLTTVPPECIKELNWTGNELEITSPEFSLGAESPILLKSIQKVDSRPQNIEIVKKLNEYLDLVNREEGETKHALRLRSELDAWGKGYEPALLKAELEIKLAKARKK